MKAYVGNRTVCLATFGDREGQEGYDILLEDGSEAWLTKEVFDFEYRELTGIEIDMVLSSIIGKDIEELEELYNIMECDVSDLLLEDAPEETKLEIVNNKEED